jgi:hypothetical protein
MIPLIYDLGKPLGLVAGDGGAVFIDARKYEFRRPNCLRVRRIFDQRDFSVDRLHVGCRGIAIVGVIYVVDHFLVLTTRPTRWRCKVASSLNRVFR